MQLSCGLSQLMSRLKSSSEPEPAAAATNPTSRPANPTSRRTNPTARLMAIIPNTGLKGPKRDLSTIIEQSRDIRQPSDASTSPLDGLSSAPTTAPRTQKDRTANNAETGGSPPTSAEADRAAPASRKTMTKKELNKKIKELKAEADFAIREIDADYRICASSVHAASGRAALKPQFARIKSQLRDDIAVLKRTTNIIK